MTDITTYRLRIGTFQKNKTKHEFISGFLRSFVIFSTLCLLAPTINENNFKTIHKSEDYSNSSLKGSQLSNYHEKNENLSQLIFSSNLPEENNFYARYTYGNRKNRGIKLSHWNAGSAHLPNILNEIEIVISRHHPHIFGISESNLLKQHRIEDVQIEDYELITAQTLSNPKLQYSRVVVYKHSSIISKVRTDLMSNEFSSIWMECGLPNKKKFLVCNLYREWQYLGQGSDKSSLDINQQLSRWLVFIDQFERALDTGMEVYCLGDINLDFLTWTRTDLKPQHRTVKVKSLIVELFNRILRRGVKQLVTTFTHSWPGQEDHFLTNAPGKISSVQVQNEGHSDHKIVHAVRVARIIRSMQGL